MLADQQTEMYVLGAALFDNRCIPTLARHLSPRDFTLAAARMAFSVAVDLADRSAPVDPVSLRTAMLEGGALQGLGWSGEQLDEFVLAAAGATATTANIEHHAETLSKYTSLRDLSEAGSRIMKLAESTDAADAHEAQTQAADMLFRLGRGAKGWTSVDLVDAAHEAVEEIKRRYVAFQQGQSPDWYLPTGISPLDSLVNGYAFGHMAVLGAQSGQGKTACAVWSGRRAAWESGRTTLYVSVEINAFDIAVRSLAAEGDLNSELLASGRWSGGHEADRTVQGHRQIKDRRGLFTIIFKPGAQVGLVRDAVQWHLRTSKIPLGLVVVDYVQRLRPRSRSGNRERDVAEMSGDLLTVAQDFQVPVLVLAQLNRDYKGRKDPTPRVSDLRESSVLEHDASLIFFLHRPAAFEESADPKVCQFVIRKNRLGRCGIVRALYDQTTGRFGDPPMRSASPHWTEAG